MLHIVWSLLWIPHKRFEPFIKHKTIFLRIPCEKSVNPIPIDTRSKYLTFYYSKIQMKNYMIKLSTVGIRLS